MQTGYQGVSIGDQSNFAPSWDLDLAVGYLFKHFALETNLGVAFSLGSSQLSKIVQVDSYLWSKLECLLYYKLSLGRQMILLGGGVGLRNLKQSASYTYQEGDVFQITSNSSRTLEENLMSTLVRLAFISGPGITLAIDYDISSVETASSPVKTLGFNMGYIF